VDFALTDEQQELGRTVRAFLEQKSPEAEVRRLMETSDGYDPALWEQMATQLGLQGLVIPEELGGSGYSVRELSVVFEEMGRALLCAPFLATTLAAVALLESGDDAAQKASLPGIAAGERTATLAHVEESGQWGEEGVAVTATADNGSWTLAGTKSYVLDGHVADTVLVTARGPRGVSLFSVAADDSGIERSPLFTMDQTRKLARLSFSATPAQLVGEEGHGWPIVERALRVGAVVLAAEQVGGAQRCLEISVEYAKERIQFGRPIGSFQAVKHRCADMLVAVEMARSAAAYASVCAANDSDDLAVAAAMAKSYCSEAYYRVAADTIQVHGGIGFTWEHPAHLYFKRAKSSELLLGTPRFHRKLLGQALGVS
jgi:alkylation response protein AidB-like acyl-CoA dehydrogenase